MSDAFVWIDPLADERWPRLVGRHSRASIFHSTGWLEALKRTYAYEPVALAAERKDGELGSAIVFCAVKSWITGCRLVSLPFSDHCNPLVDTADECEDLLAILKRQSASWKYVEVRPRDPSSASMRGFLAAATYYVHLLDLQPTLENLLHSFHANHIVRKIRRSEREKLTCEQGRSERLLEAFYALTIKTRRRHRLPPQPIEWFRSVLDCLPDQARVRVAYKGGVAIAAILTLQTPSQMVYKYGASDPVYYRCGAMQFLLWGAIRDARGQGCRVLDFGRSGVESLGEVAFKDHWGTARMSMTYWRCPGVAQRTRIGRIALGLGHRAAAFLPDRLLVTAGRVLYRHWG